MGTGIPQMELEERESDLLGESFAECVRALPSKKMKAVEASLASVMPWFGLVGALAVVGYPRYQIYQLLQQERARHAARLNNGVIPLSEARASATTAEDGNGASQGAQGKARFDMPGS